jgi:hypothetical protein
MNLKSIAVALGFVAAMTAFGTAPASANASTSSVERAADSVTSARCTCGYVRYYRVYRVQPVYRVYRVYRVRYYI